MAIFKGHATPGTNRLYFPSFFSLLSRLGRGSFFFLFFFLFSLKYKLPPSRHKTRVAGEENASFGYVRFYPPPPQVAKLPFDRNENGKKKKTGKKKKKKNFKKK
eukprot:TRINITY_DN1813_c5_g1_i1.p1 TRINITY_DN1813_c5_g1~~TRINITY_DN1813_c5_g1_i1.p1  ORF type:complete len:104 (+),score=6.77 TRINITY_DN1813_c5_g1_i1:131-442(+)